MKLIFIYGPPASGKLTTAKELSKITKFKLYHNHLAHDLVESIFDYDKYQKIFFPLIEEINFFMISKAAAEKVPGVIMTNCYVHPDDEKFIRKIKDTVENNGGDVNFVQLFCGKTELLKRVTNESRKKYGKFKDPDKLEKKLKEKNLLHGIPFVDNLVIDNTHIPANKTADRIKDHYNL